MSILTIISCVNFLYDLTTSLINKRYSFIIRYVIVFILFMDLTIFSNELVNYWITEKLSVGFCIYYLSYGIVGLLNIRLRINDRKSLKTVYFVVYIVIAFILWILMSILNFLNLLPIL